MQAMDIYEPVAGCITGACGPDGDEALASFESMLEALSRQGLQVHRFNLGHDPEEFARNATVKAAIQEEGLACLPLVLIDGRIVSRGRYPSRRDLGLEAGG